MIIEAISVLCKMGGVEIKNEKQNKWNPGFGQGKSENLVKPLRAKNL